MAQDKFLIGYNDNNSGFQSSVKPWLINDNAFETLNDAYILRGRVKKRFGTVLLSDDQKGSRLRISMGTTDGSGDLSGTVPGVVFGIGQMFSCGDDIFTVYQTGTPGDCLSTSAATCTYNTTTGAFVITGSTTLTEVFFYPATPVMGLTQYFANQTNVFSTIAFDTQFAYQYDDVNNGWFRMSAGDSIWTGENYEFFWSCGFIGAVTALNNLWVTNFTPEDGLRYWDNAAWIKPILNYTKGAPIGTTDGSGNAAGVVSGGSGFIGQVFTIGLTTFTVVVANGALLPSSKSTAGPTGTGTFNTATGAYTFTSAQANTSIFFTGRNYIQTAKIIVQFKNRLIFLNTIELVENVSVKYPYRCRYSGFNDSLGASGWVQDFPGNGGFIDAPTEQAIVTAQFVKDRLIVYFESSTYELTYTGNQIQPFVWQKINTELGAISTFSEIPFDKVVLGIDDNGIHACTGSNVDRIDSKIPQYPFSISNESHGADRVSGIRDYYNEMAYWSVVTNDRSDDFVFPNQILVYNYLNESWATITDSFTTFGYFFLPVQSVGLTWGETTTPWGQNGNLWNSPSSSTNNTTIKSVIAGNQEGFIVSLQPNIFNNAPSLQITNFTITAPGQALISCVNHNLAFNQFILLENMNGLTFTDSLGNELPSLMARVSVDPVNGGTVNSITITSLDNVSQPIITTGTYLGGGTASLVSNINILTKQYNFYTQQDRNMYLSCVDFLVDKTTNGQVTADYLTSSSPISLVSEGVGNIASPGPLPGNGTLVTSAYTLSNFEKFQTRLWHPVYMYAEGECVQLQLYMTPNQMYSYDVNEDGTVKYVALNDFEMHAMLFYVTPTSNRMQ
jgi:hypothetical protein